MWNLDKFATIIEKQTKQEEKPELMRSEKQRQGKEIVERNQAAEYYTKRRILTPNQALHLKVERLRIKWVNKCSFSFRLLRRNYVELIFNLRGCCECVWGASFKMFLSVWNVQGMLGEGINNIPSYMSCYYPVFTNLQIGEIERRIEKK